MKFLDVETGETEGVTNGQNPDGQPTQTVPLDKEARKEAGGVTLAAVKKWLEDNGYEPELAS